MGGGVLIVTRGVLYLFSLALNLLPSIRALLRLKESVTPEGLLELNILVTNLIDVTFFFVVPTITQINGYPLDSTLRQASVFQDLGCDVGERMVVIANMCLYQHIASLAITNMLSLTLCIYATYLQASLQLMDKHRTVSFIILSWTLSVLLTWPPMLIRCVYVDAIYMVSLLWLIPLVFFSVLALFMQCRLGWISLKQSTGSEYMSQVSHVLLTNQSQTNMGCSEGSIWPPPTLQETTYSGPSYTTNLEDQSQGPQLKQGNVSRLFLTQVIMTLSVLPFPTLQLLDAMSIPSTPSLFWKTPQGQVMWNLLQSLPFAHFIAQPLLILCDYKRGVLDINPISMVLFNEATQQNRRSSSAMPHELVPLTLKDEDRSYCNSPQLSGVHLCNASSHASRGNGRCMNGEVYPSHASSTV